MRRGFNSPIPLTAKTRKGLLLYAESVTQYIMNPQLIRELAWPTIFTVIVAILLALNIRHYFHGHGMKVYLLNVFDGRPFYMLRPTKTQRRWLLLNIIVGVIIFEMFAMPIFSMFALSVIRR